MKNLTELFKWLKKTRGGNQIVVNAEKELADLVQENQIMYACILEAAELKNAAAIRCKVELQRIAKKDAAK